MAQTTQTTAVQNSAGGLAQMGSWLLFATIDQPSPPDTATDGQYELYSGFIYAIEDEVEEPVDIIGPVMPPLPQQPSPLLSGEAITVATTVVDCSGVKNVFLHYRQGGDSLFQETLMQLIGNEYRGVISGGLVSNRGVEYYISAFDSSDNMSIEPDTLYISQQVTIAGHGIPAPSTQPSGSAQNSYRIVSVPLDLTNKSPGTILEDDLGKYDNKKWRFFNEAIQEYPNTGDMVPGKGFWLIVKEGGKKIDSGPGITNITNKPFKIPLKAGDNLIGNPFNFDVPVKNTRLLLDTLDAKPRLWSYTGGWEDSTQILNPFKGYYIASESTDTLIIDPDLSPGSNNSATYLPKLLFSIQIKAQSQKAKDFYNFANVITDAENEKDQFDHPEPPTIGEYVSVYFPHQEWKSTFSNYSTDSRPEFENGAVWKFGVKTNINDKVNLTFNGIKDIPNGFQVWIADENLNIATNLREDNHYEVAGSSGKDPKELQLIIGTDEFVKENLSDIVLIPTEYELSSNFPNPFNPATTIRFGLPKKDKVTLTIYNVLGQKIITLLDKESRKAGYHAAVWDGRHQNGNRVASGVYIYHLKTDNFSKSRKMMLIK